MVTLAITGGIASGKSLFSSFLAACGACIIDSDELVRSMHAPGGIAAVFVAREFGTDFLLPDGATDKQKLSSVIFSDEAARKKLEAFLHPLVRKALADHSAACSQQLCALQIPLLFETGWETDWDYSLTVEAPADKRFERLCARGLTPLQAQARIDSQLPRNTREERASFVVHNDSSAEELRRLASLLYSHLTSTNPAAQNGLV